MGEVDLCFVPLLSDFKSNFRALPLAFVFNKIKVAVQNKPNDFLARKQLCDLLLAVMDVFVPIRKLLPEFVGATFNFS